MAARPKVVARDQIAACELPQEEVDCPAIGGVVLVRGMDMPQLMRFRAAQRRASTPQAGESEEDAMQRAGGEVLPLLLESCVLAADGLPVYTAAQWGIFAVRNLQATMDLSTVALRLSGQEPDAGKP